MKSIKKDIVRPITITLAVILFSLFMAIDIVLDDWVQGKFDESLTTKSNYLKTLVKVNQDGIDFDFAGEFMPEFEHGKDAQYFQLWIDDKPFERSASLALYPEEQLAKQTLAINKTKIIDVTLPDGRTGRSIMSNFHPQVPSRLRESVPAYEHAVFFTIAVSSEYFSRALTVVDITFWLIFFTLLIGMRYLVSFQIDKGLKPLSLLNEEIARLKVDKSSSSLKKLKDEHVEIAPIRAELSRFIEFSQQSLQEEQRLSADIAHELKTPISEIISLSEMSIQYPKDHRISDSYSQDMLSIAERMKQIVNNLMMLNQSDEYLLKQQNADIELLTAINEILEALSSTEPNVFERVQISNLLAKGTVNLDIISFNMIVGNLLKNALFYSPARSTISLVIESNSQGYSQITLQNDLNHPISPEQLTHLFKPLYQIDKSRTDNAHYGLGLAIVEKLCAINGYQIEVILPEPNCIKFSLLLNKF
ncbi:MAG: signal transduction histidine kinase [Psychromonas sp.]|jgi:signal transduction histidine kinase